MSPVPRRGRPPESGAEVEVVLHLRLRRGRDDDLIDFFGAIPRRQRIAALKSALRAGGGLNALRLEDLDDDQDLDTVLDGFLF